jgi:hypothetical protein
MIREEALNPPQASFNPPDRVKEETFGLKTWGSSSAGKGRERQSGGFGFNLRRLHQQHVHVENPPSEGK